MSAPAPLLDDNVSQVHYQVECAEQPELLFEAQQFIGCVFNATDYQSRYHIGCLER